MLSQGSKDGGGVTASLYAVLALVVALLVWHFHRLWNPNGEYAYGWVVAPMAAYLFKLRWDERPTPTAPLWGSRSLAVLFALALLPSVWLLTAAPQRSLFAWSFAIACVGLSLSILAIAGGAPWLRSLSFPFLFLLTAAPWPHQLELAVTSLLMHRAAEATVEVVCLLGIPAIQAGNLIQIESGVLGIDEACSGIRSLQSMVMAALFLGEFFRLTPFPRMGMLTVSVVLALGANTVRTIALALVAAQKGMGGVDQYHDLAGNTALAFSLSASFLMAYFLRARPAPPAEPAGLTLKGPMAAAALPQVPSLPLRSPGLFRFGIGLLTWICFAEISVEAWYRFREPKWEGWSWSVHWPVEKADYHKIEIPERSAQILCCDEQKAADWKEDDGLGWSLYSFRWDPANPAAESAKVHRPDVCFASAGAVMVDDLGVVKVKVGALQIPFHRYTFSQRGKIVRIFFCLYTEDGRKSAEQPVQLYEGVGLRQALQGRRKVGMQSLEAALVGYESSELAEQAFLQRIGAYITPADRFSEAGATAPPAKQP